MMTQLGHRCPKCDEVLKRAKEQENKAALLVCKENVICENTDVEVNGS
jgi:ssDNA-binding Zn-finger/Zn-ribbon topoisomerase 1